MSALLLDPHGDDAVLFAAFTCLIEKPHIVVTHPTVPQEEIVTACAVLGCTVELWNGDNADLQSYLYKNHIPDRVFAPKVRDDGHNDHNTAGLIAATTYPSRSIFYLTYAPRGMRDHDGGMISPPAGGVAKKLRALSCFESQIEQRSTRPWFFDLLDLREWVTA